ncbi:Membrane attack complex component-perforin (MACPF) domain [Babesia duncani]|uniref:Membrane attack complex component-perforin (MACPF) domain n=1 Tax=Babesia duncani TaxID=323732 RepID=A0AAD9PIB6_9APIC|nr:Membrane attack complex component-perforin (MACPF) domain [Babesia duncani]
MKLSLLLLVICGCKATLGINALYNSPNALGFNDTVELNEGIESPLDNASMKPQHMHAPSLLQTSPLKSVGDEYQTNPHHERIIGMVRGHNLDMNRKKRSIIQNKSNGHTMGIDSGWWYLYFINILVQVSFVEKFKLFSRKKRGVKPTWTTPKRPSKLSLLRQKFKRKNKKQDTSDQSAQESKFKGFFGGVGKRSKNTMGDSLSQSVPDSLVQAKENPLGLVSDSEEASKLTNSIGKWKHFGKNGRNDVNKKEDKVEMDNPQTDQSGTENEPDDNDDDGPEQNPQKGPRKGILSRMRRSLFSKFPNDKNKSNNRMHGGDESGQEEQEYGDGGDESGQEEQEYGDGGDESGQEEQEYGDGSDESGQEKEEEYGDGGDESGQEEEQEYGDGSDESGQEKEEEYGDGSDESGQEKEEEYGDDKYGYNKRSFIQVSKNASNHDDAAQELDKNVHSNPVESNKLLEPKSFLQGENFMDTMKGITAAYNAEKQKGNNDPPLVKFFNALNTKFPKYLGPLMKKPHDEGEGDGDAEADEGTEGEPEEPEGEGDPSGQIGGDEGDEGTEGEPEEPEGEGDPSGQIGGDEGDEGTEGEPEEPEGEGDPSGQLGGDEGDAGADEGTEGEPEEPEGEGDPSGQIGGDEGDAGADEGTEGEPEEPEGDGDAGDGADEGTEGEPEEPEDEGDEGDGYGADEGDEGTEGEPEEPEGEGDPSGQLGGDEGDAGADEGTEGEPEEPEGEGDPSGQIGGDEGDEGTEGEPEEPEGEGDPSGQIGGDEGDAGADEGTEGEPEEPEGDGDAGDGADEGTEGEPEEPEDEGDEGDGYGADEGDEGTEGEPEEPEDEGDEGDGSAEPIGEPEEEEEEEASRDTDKGVNGRNGKLFETKPRNGNPQSKDSNDETEFENDNTGLIYNRESFIETSKPISRYNGHNAASKRFDVDGRNSTKTTTANNFIQQEHNIGDINSLTEAYYIERKKVNTDTPMVQILNILNNKDPKSLGHPVNKNRYPGNGGTQGRIKILGQDFGTGLQDGNVKQVRNTDGKESNKGGDFKQKQGDNDDQEPGKNNGNGQGKDGGEGQGSNGGKESGEDPPVESGGVESEGNEGNGSADSPVESGGVESEGNEGNGSADSPVESGGVESEGDDGDGSADSPVESGGVESEGDDGNGSADSPVESGGVESEGDGGKESGEDSPVESGGVESEGDDGDEGDKSGGDGGDEGEEEETGKDDTQNGHGILSFIGLSNTDSERDSLVKPDRDAIANHGKIKSITNNSFIQQQQHITNSITGLESTSFKKERKQDKGAPSIQILNVLNYKVKRPNGKLMNRKGGLDDDFAETSMDDDDVENVQGKEEGKGKEKGGADADADEDEDADPDAEEGYGKDDGQNGHGILSFIGLSNHASKLHGNKRPLNKKDVNLRVSNNSQEDSFLERGGLLDSIMNMATAYNMERKRIKKNPPLEQLMNILSYKPSESLKDVSNTHDSYRGEPDDTNEPEYDEGSYNQKFEHDRDDSDQYDEDQAQNPEEQYEYGEPEYNNRPFSGRFRDDDDEGEEGDDDNYGYNRGSFIRLPESVSENDVSQELYKNVHSNLKKFNKSVNPKGLLRGKNFRNAFRNLSAAYNSEKAKGNNNHPLIQILNVLNYKYPQYFGGLVNESVDVKDNDIQDHDEDSLQEPGQNRPIPRDNGELDPTKITDNEKDKVITMDKNKVKVTEKDTTTTVGNDQVKITEKDKLLTIEKDRGNKSRNNWLYIDKKMGKIMQPVDDETFKSQENSDGYLLENKKNYKTPQFDYNFLQTQTRQATENGANETGTNTSQLHYSGENTEKVKVREDKGENVDDFISPSGLEYLGAGYDLIKGNPLGDLVTLLDPGYRGNILQMHWSLNFEGISSSMKFIQPLGAWIRPYPSCHKVETLKELSSESLLQSDMKADASVTASLGGDSASFSASASYKNFAKNATSTTTRTYYNKSYCFKYVAGLPTSVKWDFTLGFQAALEGIETSLSVLKDESKCSIESYKMDPRSQECHERGITKWMDLFQIFGTHVATRIYLGGKILTTIEAKTSQVAEAKEKNIDIQVKLQAELESGQGIDIGARVSEFNPSESNDYVMDLKKTTYVVGGDVYGFGKPLTFAEWSQTVYEFAMPIKAEYSPLANFLPDKLARAYEYAYFYYTKVTALA